METWTAAAAEVADENDKREQELWSFLVISLSFSFFSVYFFVICMTANKHSLDDRDNCAMGKIKVFVFVCFRLFSEK
jgi:hypothetical protein